MMSRCSRALKLQNKIQHSASHEFALCPERNRPGSLDNLRQLFLEYIRFLSPPKHRISIMYMQGVGKVVNQCNNSTNTLAGAEIWSFLNPPSGLYPLGSETQSCPLAFQESPHPLLSQLSNWRWRIMQETLIDRIPNRPPRHKHRGHRGPPNQTVYMKWLLLTSLVGKSKSSVKSRDVFSHLQGNVGLSLHHFGPDWDN